jgi:hypothetical protein
MARYSAFTDAEKSFLHATKRFGVISLILMGSGTSGQ